MNYCKEECYLLKQKEAEVAELSEKIVHVISKKYAEESNKVTLEDSSALERAILMEF